MDTDTAYVRLISPGNSAKNSSEELCRLPHALRLNQPCSETSLNRFFLPQAQHHSSPCLSSPHLQEENIWSEETIPSHLPKGTATAGLYSRIKTLSKVISILPKWSNYSPVKSLVRSRGVWPCCSGMFPAEQLVLFVSPME